MAKDAKFFMHSSPKMKTKVGKNEKKLIFPYFFSIDYTKVSNL